jgi:hypothetical protein
MSLKWSSPWEVGQLIMNSARRSQWIPMGTPKYASIQEVQIAVKTDTGWVIEVVVPEPSTGDVIGGLTDLRMGSIGTAHSRRRGSLKGLNWMARRSSGHPDISQAGTYQITIVASDGQTETSELVVGNIYAPVQISSATPSAATVIAATDGSLTFEIRLIPAVLDAIQDILNPSIFVERVEGLPGPGCLKKICFKLQIEPHS